MQVKTKQIFRQLLTVPFALTLCSCELDKPATGYAYFPDVFRGMVISDEPQTLEYGREMLRSGGNAFDAALTMSFAYMVTYPSRVSVFSSGECAYYDASAKQAKEISFSSDDDYNLVPELPRALYKIYAEKGTKNFSEIIAPAENAANFGFNISKQLSDDINNSSVDVSKLLTGQQYDVGYKVKNPALGRLFSEFRNSGVGIMYNGSVLNNYINEAENYSYKIDKSAINKFIPQIKEINSPKINGNDEIYVSKPNYRVAQKEANLLVVDKDGNAVACRFSNDELFGSGKYISSLGSFVAKSRNSSSYDIELRVNKYVKSFREISLAGNKVLCNEGLPEFPDSCEVKSINYSRFEGTPPQRKKLIFRKEQNKYENL